VDRKDLPCAAHFPFDGSLALRGRWQSVFEEQDLVGEPQEWGKAYIEPLYAELKEPYPYVACIVADGDRMGRAISSLSSAAHHRLLSLNLSAFAGRARGVVEQTHQGVTVYAGGDDVLAFVPVANALSCAKELQLCFDESLAHDSLSAENRPTLSIGLGIGHVMESMGDLLSLGRLAEREAKRSRNALAVVLDKRSGGQRFWSATWDTNPVSTLARDGALLNAQLSVRKIYEIERLVMQLPEDPAAEDRAWTRLLALEVQRSLSRVEGSSLNAEMVNLDLSEEVGYLELRQRVKDWISRLLIAREFIAALPSPLKVGVESA
ncbi:MAG TPA: type III-B CRISPR-associated protein Cas10/Cmr2, partial [Edaphobacter sp.]|nr:type III-B CRISPR-associated protein Cas10/Cmr2 [Edaphobacter sp.]